jgi:tetratricopeptide (TPR) repeat protein
MNAHHERAFVLFQQSRFEEAVAELQRAIEQEPEEAFHYALMGLCLGRLNRGQAGMEAVRKAIEIAPDDGYVHFVLAMLHIERGARKEARESVLTAIELDPDDANNYGLLARIEFESKNWEKAIEAADEGLRLDPGQDVCRHYRSLTFTQLGRKEEAENDFSAMLEKEPNDPCTHAAQGWYFLHQGDATNARRHFLESLRLDPTNDEARDGLAHALKARYFLFGWILQALLYLNRFRGWALLIFFLALGFGMERMNRFARAHPDWYLYFWLLEAGIWTVLIAIAIADPLFDLVLRLDPEGRHTFSEVQIRASNWNAVCFVVALGFGFLWAFKGSGLAAKLAFATLWVTGAIAATASSSAGWVRTRMKWVTILCAALIPLSYILIYLWIFLLVKYRAKNAWLVTLIYYLPTISVLISVFSSDIAAYLERRRPDHLGRLSPSA